jgi:hypothetical protein
MRRRSTNFLSMLLLVAVLPCAFYAQEAGAQERQQSKIQGVLSGGVIGALQDTDQGGSSFDDAVGMDFSAGFSVGNTFTWLLGYQLVAQSNYSTHFIPVSVRMYSPDFLDRVRVYGQGGIGLFFAQVSGQHGSADSTRASAVRIGGGLEVDIMENLSGYIDAGWTNGLGSANSFKYGTLGLGVVYRWDI